MTYMRAERSRSIWQVFGHSMWRVPLLPCALLAACSSEARVVVSCGMPADEASLRTVLASHQSCPKCLLDAASKVSTYCPTGPAVGTLAFYAATRIQRVPEALRFYRGIADASGVSSEVHADAGYILRREGRNDAALAAYEHAQGLRSDPFLRLEIAFIMRDLGRQAEAIQALRTVIAETTQARRDAKPGVVGVEALYDDAAFALADIYLEEGDVKSAERIYQEVLVLDPDNTRALEALRLLSAESARYHGHASPHPLHLHPEPPAQPHGGAARRTG